MNKKVVLLIVLLVGCVLCIGCVVLGYLGYSAFSGSITAETSLIKTTNLDHICPTAGNITVDDGSYFTDSFTNTYDYEHTVTLLNQVFPAGFDCTNLLPGEGKDFIGMLTHGQGFTLGTTNGQTTAVLTFTSGGVGRTINFTKVDGTWVIDDIK